MMMMMMVMIPRTNITLGFFIDDNDIGDDVLLCVDVDVDDDNDVDVDVEYSNLL